MVEKTKLYQAPRGTADILPEEQAYWYHVEQKAREICRLYGYKQIKTPIFEDAGLFNRSVGEGTDIMDKEIYMFEDRGENKLALIPEGTAVVCRAYLEHGMHNQPQPIKLFYITPIFRYDRPQAGRYRQHHQFGCEAIGDPSPVIDAELIEIAWKFYKSLGIDDINLLINSIGCRECRPKYLEKLVAHYRDHYDEICQDCKTRIEVNPMRLLDCKNTACQSIAESAPKSMDNLCDDCQKHMNDVERYLDILAIPYTVKHRLVRGLDYYTRTVFEVEPQSAGSQSSLGGGGRYDHLIEMIGGKPTPGMGFGSGIERIILNMKEQNVPVPQVTGPQVYIAHMGEKAADKSIELAAEIRKTGIGVTNATGVRSLKAQLRQANSSGVSYTLIIGDDEVAKGEVVLRNMNDANQESVDEKNLVEKLISLCSTQ